MTAAMGINIISNYLIGKASDISVWMGFASILVYVALLIISLFGLNSKMTVSEMKVTGFWSKRQPNVENK
jgi:hypothetical protein